MEPRLNLHTNDFAIGFYKRFNAAGRVVTDSTLSMTIQHLVKLRASQINGCGFCTDMHSKDAAHEGETSVRLNLVAAWRDATVFTPAERAALALAEEGTRLADGDTGVPDQVWADAREHFDDDQAGRTGVPDRDDQRLQPTERDHRPPRRQLRTRPVRLIPAVESDILRYHS